MTGPELRARLEALGYTTPAERARVVGMDRSEYHNQESGRRPVSRFAQARVELLECRAATR